eukprot:TRINITY_DN12537_c0_g1_i1.p1 TRINITY_DN12537_c0_g1~~TRINITY_DN12537_c0_g1_i1.p1  ORF type:complete len:869 (+),score=205.13 TRINITY_DN12537_c0_g1_i1:156-2762(+)
MVIPTENQEASVPVASMTSIAVMSRNPDASMAPNPTVARKADPDLLDDDEAMDDEDETTRKLAKHNRKGKTKVDKESLLDYVEAQEHQKQIFLQLPFSVLYFACFIVMVFGHLSIYSSAMVQREHRSMLAGTTYEGVAFTSGHKDIEDIDTKEDIYTFLKEVVVPMYIQPYGPNDPYRNLRYNQLIGGILLQQLRRDRVDCTEEHPNIGPFEEGTESNPILKGFECYPFDSESRDCFGPDPLTLDGVTGWCPDTKKDKEKVVRRLSGMNATEATAGRRLDYVQQGGGSGGYKKGNTAPSPENTFTVYLNEYEGVTRNLKKVQILQDNGWIDFHTAWVGVKFLVFNPDLGMFVHVVVSIYIPPSGIFLPHIAMQSFQPMFFMDSWVIVWDLVWSSMLLWFTIRVILGIAKAARHRQMGGWFTNGWNWIDICCCVGGYTLLLTYLFLFSGLNVVKDKAMDVRMNDPLAARMEGATDAEFAEKVFMYEDLVSSMHWEASSLSSNFMNGKMLLCWYTVMIAVKFLQCFSAQPKLAVVTNTLKEAGTDVGHFLIVFLAIYFAFAISGMFMFGRRMWEFSSFTQSCISCFLMCLGEFDMSEYTTDMQYTGFIWFFLFQVLLILLMMNMLMAIIMDQYTEVKANASSAVPIWAQGWEVFHDSISKITGHAAGSANIVKKLAELETKSGQVDELDLITHVGSTMSHEQARYLIAETQRREEDEFQKGFSMSDAMKMIGYIKIACGKIESRLGEVLAEERADLMDLQALYDPIAAGEAIDCADTGPPEPVEYDDGVGMSVREGDGRLDWFEDRLDKVDDFLQEAAQYATFRGKDLRNRLMLVEELMRSKRGGVAAPTATAATVPEVEQNEPTALADR